tara:strand:+ start:2522 stop:2797 length:276 start_codon:yes stop_codon:yes gene_type:complete
MLTAVGASVCASGSQLCKGNNGSLIANPTKKIRNIIIDGIKILKEELEIPIRFNSVMSYITNVPVAKYTDNMPIRKKAPEVRVKIKNFIAE